MDRPLRLLIYDRTCVGRRGLPLTHVWRAGGYLYAGLGVFDAAIGADSWEDALSAVARLRPSEPIGEIQYWGHGRWGLARIDHEPLSAASLAPTSPLRPLLEPIRERMSPASRWWFRTCETFGAARGQAFARAWTDFFGCAAAGHTFIVGPWQSGLYLLRPGEEPWWPADEGLAAGTPREPTKALWSRPGRPNTVSCLAMDVPSAFAQPSAGRRPP